nr:MobQ family relaxase [Dyella kyungheensis]
MASPSPCGPSGESKIKSQGQPIAIFHASTKPLSRSAGRSSVAAAAYRAGVVLIDRRTGVIHDYTRRSGVVASELIAPGGVILDRAELWNAAEQAEARKDARTAREWVLALPAELDDEERAVLVREFGRELATRYGVAVDVAIHEPDREGDKRNHHAHVLTTTRVVAGGVLGEKASIELSDTKRRQLGLSPAADEVKALRECWAEMANRALGNAGQEARIDHRSLADQQVAAMERGDLQTAFALDRPAQTHVGVHAMAMDRRAHYVRSDRGQKRVDARAAQRETEITAEARAAQAVMAEWDEAAAQVVVAEDAPSWANAGAVDLTNWASVGPVDPTNWASVGPVDPTNWASVGPVDPMNWASVGPLNPPEATTMSPSITAPPRPVDELRTEAARLSRTVAQRLDAVPTLAAGRAARRQLRVEAARDEQAYDTARLSAESQAKRASDWKREHPVRAMLAGIVKPKELRQIEANQADWLRQAEQHKQAGLQAIDRHNEIRREQAAEEARHRPAIEAQYQADQVQLAKIRAELAVAEAAAVEAVELATEVTPELAPALPALDQLRAARFEAGKVETPGAPYCLQLAYNETRKAGQVDWDAVAIYGTAKALASDNDEEHCAAALAKWWPGEQARVQELVEQGRAQALIDHVRTRLADGREPRTEEGRMLAAVVCDHDDAIARAAVVATYETAVEVVGNDSALRPERDSEHLAPELR